jgi:hypothetical protein
MAKALMAKFSTLKHSKTLGKMQPPNFSTLAPKPPKMPDLCRALAARSTWAEVRSFRDARRLLKREGPATILVLS